MEQLNDSMTGYANLYPRSRHHRARDGSNGTFFVKSGEGYTYKWAATVGGIGVQADTTHSTDTYQTMHFFRVAAMTRSTISTTAATGHRAATHQPRCPIPTRSFYDY